MRRSQKIVELTATQQRRPKRAALLLFSLCVLAVSAALLLTHAWRETVRREAYLPELEAQAARSLDDGRLQALLGARLFEAAEYQAAAETLKRSLAAGEQNDQLWVCLAAASAASGDTQHALADLRLGQKFRPASPALAASRERVRRLGPQASPEALARAICPDGPQVLLDDYASGSFLNGLSSWWGRRHPERSGFATRQEWARQQPNNAQAQRLWGLALLRNRRVPEAAAVLTRALTLAPDSPALNLAVADALDQGGQASKAALQYLHCLQLRPNWLPALLGLGRTSERSGLKANALSSYEKATAIAPNSAEAWIGLGRAYGVTGSTYDKSVIAFEKALRLAPGRTDFYDDYAAALSHTARVRDAEALLRKRLQAAPGDAYAHYLLGTVLMNNSPTPTRLAEAEFQTREALRLSPHNPQADVQLATIVLPQGKVAEAITLLTDALQRNTFDRTAMSLLARAYRQSGQNGLAEKVARQANKLFDDQQRVAVLEDKERRSLLDVTIHEQLAALYSRIGQDAKAEHERQMIALLRKDPQAAAQLQKSYQASVKAALGTP